MSITNKMSPKGSVGSGVSVTQVPFDEELRADLSDDKRSQEYADGSS